jgi:hypothetical protein
VMRLRSPVDGSPWSRWAALHRSPANVAATLLDAFEGRRMLIAYYFMWHTGHPAPEQCEGCTWVTSRVRELSYIHSRDVTFAVFCQGPYEESARYRDFIGWEMPWYSAQDSLATLLVGRRVGMMQLSTSSQAKCPRRGRSCRGCRTCRTEGRGMPSSGLSSPACATCTMH